MASPSFTLFLWNTVPSSAYAAGVLISKQQIKFALNETTTWNSITDRADGHTEPDTNQLHNTGATDSEQ